MSGILVAMTVFVAMLTLASFVMAAVNLVQSNGRMFAMWFLIGMFQAFIAASGVGAIWSLS